MKRKKQESVSINDYNFKIAIGLQGMEASVSTRSGALNFLINKGVESIPADKRAALIKKANEILNPKNKLP